MLRQKTETAVNDKLAEGAAEKAKIGLGHQWENPTAEAIGFQRSGLFSEASE
jgi:hypothetical protein